MNSDIDIYFEELRRSLQEDLGLQAAPPAPPAPQPGIAFMITRRQREELRALGYSDEQIRGLTPDGARQILSQAQMADTSSATRP